MVFVANPLPQRKVTVAASDSTRAARANAAYRCTGTADEVKINQAITEANGAVVEMEEGNYTIAGTIAVGVASTRLTGKGLITHNTPAAVEPMISITADNVQVSGISLDGTETQADYQTNFDSSGDDHEGRPGIKVTGDNCSISQLTVSGKAIGLRITGQDANVQGYRFNGILGVPQAFTADAPTNVCTATAHGFSDDDLVTLRNSDTPGDALPAGLTVLTNYYIISSTTHTFKLSASIAGAEIDITDSGTGTHWIQATPTVGANFCSGISVTGQRFTVSDSEGYNCGTLVTGGSSVLEPKVDNCTVSNYYDNGVYFSSSYRATVTDCTITYGNNFPSGIKVRGQGSTVGNNIIYKSNGVGISIEGLSSATAPFILDTEFTDALVYWVSGNARPQIGETVTGVDSAATGVIANVAQFTGVFADGNARGYFYLTTRTGTFNAVERLTGSRAGASAWLKHATPTFSGASNVCDGNTLTSIGRYGVTADTTATGLSGQYAPVISNNTFRDCGNQSGFGNLQVRAMEANVVGNTFADISANAADCITMSVQTPRIKTFTATAVDDKFAAVAHGFSNGEILYLWPGDGGTLPVGFDETTPYYVVNKTDDDYELSLSSGGAAVDVTGDSVGECWASDSASSPIYCINSTVADNKIMSLPDGVIGINCSGAANIQLTNNTVTTHYTNEAINLGTCFGAELLDNKIQGEVLANHWDWSITGGHVTRIFLQAPTAEGRYWAAANLKVFGSITMRPAADTLLESMTFSSVYSRPGDAICLDLLPVNASATGIVIDRLIIDEACDWVSTFDNSSQGAAIRMEDVTGTRLTVNQMICKGHMESAHYQALRIDVEAVGQFIANGAWIHNSYSVTTRVQFVVAGFASQDYLDCIIGHGPVAYKTFTAAEATDVLTSSAHGFSDEDGVYVWAEAGGTLPTGLSVQTKYFVVNANANDLQLEASVGAGPINLTVDSSGTCRIALTDSQVSAAPDCNPTGPLRMQNCRLYNVANDGGMDAGANVTTFHWIENVIVEEVGSSLTGDPDIGGATTLVARKAELPTSDPVNTGEWWVDTGTVKVS